MPKRRQGEDSAQEEKRVRFTDQNDEHEVEDTEDKTSAS